MEDITPTFGFKKLQLIEKSDKGRKLVFLSIIMFD